jgi:hypothetical protein
VYSISPIASTLRYPHAQFCQSFTSVAFVIETLAHILLFLPFFFLSFPQQDPTAFCLVAAFYDMRATPSVVASPQALCDGTNGFPAADTSNGIGPITGEIGCK